MPVTRGGEEPECQVRGRPERARTHACVSGALLIMLPGQVPPAGDGEPRLRRQHHEGLLLLGAQLRAAAAAHHCASHQGWCTVLLLQLLTLRLGISLPVVLGAGLAARAEHLELSVPCFLHTPPRHAQHSGTGVQMEVGIEDCLHIEFEYDKGRYHLKDTVVGKIYFLLVRRAPTPPPVLP